VKLFDSLGSERPRVAFFLGWIKYKAMQKRDRMADEYAVKPSEHAQRIDTIHRNLKQCLYAPYDSHMIVRFLIGSTMNVNNAFMCHMIVRFLIGSTMKLDLMRKTEAEPCMKLYPFAN